MQVKCLKCKHWVDYKEADIWGVCKDCRVKERVKNWKGEKDETDTATK